MWLFYLDYNVVNITKKVIVTQSFLLCIHTQTLGNNKSLYAALPDPSHPPHVKLVKGQLHTQALNINKSLYADSSRWYTTPGAINHMCIICLLYFRCSLLFGAIRRKLKLLSRTCYDVVRGECTEFTFVILFCFILPITLILILNNSLFSELSNDILSEVSSNLGQVIGKKSKGTSEPLVLRLWASLAFEICTGFRIQHNTLYECFILPYGLSRKPLSPTYHSHSSVIFLGFHPQPPVHKGV